MVLATDPNASNYDFRAFVLDAYSIKAANIITLLDLVPYMELERQADRNIGWVDVGDYVPNDFWYKRSVFPLGDFDYVIVGKIGEELDAYKLPESEASTLFDIYRFEGSTLEFILVSG